MLKMIPRIGTVVASSALIAAALLLSGCGDGGGSRSAKFAVLSDPHLYDGETLGTAGADFAAYLEADPKMLAESGEIVSAAVDLLKAAPLDFVMVAGDLTKDGELASHRLMASKLAALRASGRKVFVIPGNHDINNPQAVSYKTSPPSPVARVSPEEFRRIYAEFGYNDALFSDPDSLSYVVEPVPGVWLFAIDSCEYANNPNQVAPTTAGSLSDATLAWLMDRLGVARAHGKTVIGMMHHGMVEHLTGQALLYPEYLLRNWQGVSKQLSDNGLNAVFTGHFHANDVTMRDVTSSVLHDVETGSLASYPSPFRMVDLDIQGKQLQLRTAYVTSIPSHAADFQAYARKFTWNGLAAVTNKLLSDPPYGLNEPVLSAVASRIVDGMMAHYAGDEAPDITTMATYMGMLGSPEPATQALGQALAALWTDLPPGDNEMRIAIGSR